MPLYREVADLTVDTNGRSPADVVQELAEQLAGCVATGPQVRVRLVPTGLLRHASGREKPRPS
jgi:hypothetical protein